MTRLRTGLQEAPVWLYLPLTLVWSTATMMVGYTMSNVMMGDPAFSGFPAFVWIGVSLASVVAVAWHVVAVRPRLTGLTVRPGWPAGPGRPGSGSAGGAAAVDRLVTGEADVGHAVAAGQPGELLLQTADLGGGQQGGDHRLLGVEPGDLSGRAEPGQG